MMPNKSISILIWFVALALVPSILLYLLFSGNQASVSWLNGAIVLGGPIATFFALFFIISKTYQRVLISRDSALDRRVETISPLLGTWEIRTSSKGSGRKAVSELELRLEDGDLEILGGQFCELSHSGGRGTAIGHWTSDLSIFDGRRLVYLYQLTDSKSNPRDWRGIVQATYNVRENRFEGSWQVFGPAYHEGDLTMAKADGAK